jgi:hypothetical protein
MEMSEQLYIDSDEDGIYSDYSDSGAYYSNTYGEYNSHDTYGYSYSQLYNPYDHYYTYSSSYSYAGSGDYNSNYELRVDTDGDGLYETNNEDYRYYENSGYNAYDSESWSNTTLYNIPEHYYLSTSSYSYAYSGEYGTGSYLVVDTEGDGDFNGGDSQQDYSSYTWEGYDAEDGYSSQGTELWDIPNGYYYATSSYSNAFSSSSGDWWRYAQDFDEDGNIEFSNPRSSEDGGGFYSISDDAYQEYRMEHWVDGEGTETQTWASLDGSNALGAYYWAYTDQGSRTNNGDYWMNTETANVNGYARAWSGYDITDYDDGYGDRTWNHSITQVYGSYYLEVHNWAYDAGDNGTWTQYNQDTDGDTAWDNTGRDQPIEDNFEVASRSWDTYEGASHMVGYWVDDYATQYTYQEQVFNPAVDTYDYYNVNYTTGDYVGMWLAYESGTTTAWSGALEAGVGMDTYQWIYFDGSWAALPSADFLDLEP